MEINLPYSNVLGNRLTRTDSPSLTPPPATTDPSAWGYDVMNRLLTRPGVTYTYDNNGNTLTKTDFTGTTTYGYDYENRLTSVSAPGGLTASYAYDPFGRRISKTVNGVTTQYLYDGMNILKEYDGTGTLLATYVHGPGIDQPIAMTRGGQTYYYHADGLGSITGLTNSSQTVVQNYGYDGFGNLNQTPTVQNPYTYTGREWDPETGLYYYRARYYDPKVGRFLQKDPIGFKGGDINLYVYVGNNPINKIDPYGLQGATCTTCGQKCQQAYNSCVAVVSLQGGSCAQGCILLAGRAGWLVGLVCLTSCGGRAAFEYTLCRTSRDNCLAGC